MGVTLTVTPLAQSAERRAAANHTVAQLGEMTRVPMREMRLPGVVPRPWSRLDTPRRILLGGCLLVLVISGCTMGSQGQMSPHAPGASPSHVSQHDLGRADYVAAGGAYCNYSQLATAIACYQRALAGTDQQRSKGWILRDLGWAYYEVGQYADAIASHEQALAIARQERDRALEGATLQNLSAAYWRLGHSTKAMTSLEQALAISRGLRNRARESIVLNILGLTYASLSQYTQAIAAFEQAVAMTRQRSNQAQDVRGRRPSRAPRVAMTRQRHNPAQEARPLMNLGSVYNRLGQDEHARVSLEQALAIAQKAGHRDGEASALAHLGEVYRGLRQYDRAIASLEQALTV
jgi:tetratricopeptide (TPR) repeat protein